MLTPRNPNLWLAALLVLSSACGDDDETGDTDGGGNTGGTTGGNTGGDDAGGNSGDFGASCKSGGRYDGFKGSDIKANIATEGECITDEEILEICAIDPAAIAAAEGKKCFSTGDKVRTCTIEGDSSVGAMGLRKQAPGLSDGCLGCFADSVICSVQNCAAPCLADPAGADCNKCREDSGCTPTFYDNCSGLPRAEDIK